MNNSPLLNYGAPLTSAFRSLSPSALPQNKQPAATKVPQQPELNDLTDQIYDSRELAALARYFGLGGK